MDAASQKRHTANMIRILAIAGDNKAGEAYLHLIERFGGTGILASETESILTTMRTVPLNGVLINMPTLLRLHGEGRGEFNDILSCFNVLRCRIDRESGELTVFEQGQASPEQAVSQFITQCAALPARTIRREERIPATFSVLLSPSATFEPDATERTITINASEHGVFCFSTKLWKPGATAWLQFLDLSDKTPISGMVMHATRWGKGCHQPGCGLRLTAITPEQQAEYSALLHKACGMKGKTIAFTASESPSPGTPS